MWKLVIVAILVSGCSDNNLAETLKELGKKCNEGGGKNSLTVRYEPGILNNGSVSLHCDDWRPK